MTQDDRSTRTPEAESGPAAETNEPTPPPGKAERESTFTRRALLQAGWTMPVIVAATLPETAYAQSGHTDHTDHTDTAHVDAHGDLHGDVAHADVHTDT